MRPLRDVDWDRWSRWSVRATSLLLVTLAAAATVRAMNVPGDDALAGAIAASVGGLVGLGTILGLRVAFRAQEVIVGAFSGVLILLGAGGLWALLQGEVTLGEAGWALVIVPAGVLAFVLLTVAHEVALEVDE